MPVTGEGVPVSVRLALALALSASAVLQTAAAPAQSLTGGVSLPTLFTLVSEFVIGALMGMVIVLYLNLFSLAGHLAGLQMLLGLAELNNLADNAGITIIAQIFQLTAMLMFFLFNGHLVCFLVLLESLRTLPPGEFYRFLDGFPGLIRLFAWYLSSGFLLALPVITCLLIINLAFGFMSRFAPQLNLFTLGFPLMIMAGMVILALVINLLPFGFERFSLYALQQLRALVQL